MRRTADSDVGAQDRTNRGPFSGPASASLHFTVAVVYSPRTRRHTNGPNGGIFAAHYASHSPAHSASLQLSVGQGTPRCHRRALPSHSGRRGAAPQPRPAPYAGGARLLRKLRVRSLGRRWRSQAHRGNARVGTLVLGRLSGNRAARTGLGESRRSRARAGLGQLSPRHPGLHGPTARRL